MSFAVKFARTTPHAVPIPPSSPWSSCDTVAAIVYIPLSANCTSILLAATTSFSGTGSPGWLVSNARPPVSTRVCVSSTPVLEVFPSAGWSGVSRWYSCEAATNKADVLMPSRLVSPKRTSRIYGYRWWNGRLSTSIPLADPASTPSIYSTAVSCDDVARMMAPSSGELFDDPISTARSVSDSLFNLAFAIPVFNSTAAILPG